MQRSSSHGRMIALLLAAIVSGVVLILIYRHFTNYQRSDWIWGEDIVYIWRDCQHIADGENPYARIATSDMRTNVKYPTYFPLFYELGAAVQIFGAREFHPWLEVWRPIFLACHFAIGVGVFWVIERREMTLLAVLGAMLWWFNRWTLLVLSVGQIDFIPILLMLLSLWLIARKRLWDAAILLGLSLAFKQIAIFLVPLYAIWAWQTSPRAGAKRAILTCVAIAIVPLLASLPFLIWDPRAFVSSILFSATRDPNTHVGADSLDAVLGLSGFSARLIMIALMTIVYLLAARRCLGVYSAALLVMIVFVDFNSVLFRQYMAWVVPLVPLAISEIRSPLETRPWNSSITSSTIPS